jgi:hypothetical protein
MLLGEYVEDTADLDLDQESVFNALTNNGQNQGLYLQNGKVYLNAEYMGAGALKIGGSGHTAIPSIIVQDANNNTIFQANASAMIWNATNSSMDSTGAISAKGTFSTEATKTKSGETYTRKVTVGDGSVDFDGTSGGTTYDLGAIESDFRFVRFNGTVYRQPLFSMHSPRIDIRTDGEDADNTPAIVTSVSDTGDKIYIRTGGKIEMKSYKALEIESENGRVDIGASENILISAGDNHSATITADEIYLSANDIYLSGTVHYSN